MALTVQRSQPVVVLGPGGLTAFGQAAHRLWGVCWAESALHRLGFW